MTGFFSAHTPRQKSRETLIQCFVDNPETRQVLSPSLFFCLLSARGNLFLLYIPPPRANICRGFAFLGAHLFGRGAYEIRDMSK